MNGRRLSWSWKLYYKNSKRINLTTKVSVTFCNEFDFCCEKNEIVKMSCPECGVDLQDPTDTCNLCSAPMFVFHLPKGGVVEGCLRKGCVYHKMKIVDAESLLGRMFENSTLESYL